MLAVADIAILSLLLLSGLLGLWRGFIVEVMSLGSWIAAFWAAWVLGEPAMAMLEGLIETPALRMALGYGGSFVAVLCLGGLATWLLSRMVKRTGLSATDRLLGFGFGVVRGVAICALLIFLLAFTPLSQLPEWRESVLIARLQPWVDWLRQALPSFAPTPLELPAPAAQTSSTP